MLRRVRASIALAACTLSAPAAAQSPVDEASAESATPSPEEGWRTEVSGYFRAPAALGVSSRPRPDDLAGPSHTQVSYGPNRTVDANYYSFAYTRLQEQDWAEVFIHAKKKHVDAAVGWMGYWYASAGFRNPDAAWVPGMAYLTLDTDFELASLRPSLAVTMGAWWPSFGAFPKYDTYTLGRFRQVGEQARLTIPVNPDVTLSLIEGFGTGRDGSFNYGAPPFYGAITGLDLLTWENVELSVGDLLDVGLHYNAQWTLDPNLAQQTVPGDKSYGQVEAAHMTTLGAEATLSVPRAGRLWISPSLIHIKNGWAIANSGTEVMHSLGGAGIATNYFAWTGSPSDSTGSGTLFNLGFLYENTLSGIQGKTPKATLPEVTFSVFGLLASASLDLPATSTLPQDGIHQFKYGADVAVQALDWLELLGRFDSANYDLDHKAYVFDALTARAAFASHFLSSERMYIQFTHYIYGDRMVLNGTWPWGAPLVAGSNVLQQGPYAGKTPDENVIKLQADIAF
ncbi:MAG TPA: hypothetical protein VMG12_03525 [Polyangiaceae bacterium]|nr:hypothetical protein [Polyangiaceae bacterium]